MQGMKTKDIYFQLYLLYFMIKFLSTDQPRLNWI